MQRNMYVCMYVCKLYIHNIYTQSDIRAYECMYVYYVYVQVHIRTITHVYIYTYICIHICTYIYTSIYLFDIYLYLQYSRPFYV